MYFFLACICFFIFSMIIIKYLLSVTAIMSAKKKVYEIKKNDDKYFFVSLFSTFSKSFTSIAEKINNKFINDYIQKVNNILKTLEEPYTKFNGYNFIVLQFVVMLAGICLSILLFGLDIVIMVSCGILFFILPYIKIYEEHRKKTSLIIKQLPNLADLLAVMIASGIDFNNAVIKISLILQGCLSKELKTVISKVSFGIDIKKALNEMAEKYNIDQLNLFVRTVNSTLESGLGITDALNKISQQIKIENASLAEKKAHEAPVKILVPMTFLILPTIFILLFAPIIISFLKTGSLF